MLANFASNESVANTIVDESIPILIPLTNCYDEGILEMSYIALSQLPKEKAAVAIQAYWDNWELENEDAAVQFEKQIRRMWMKSKFGWEMKLPGLTDPNVVMHLRNVQNHGPHNQAMISERERRAAIRLQAKARGLLQVPLCAAGACSF